MKKGRDFPPLPFPGLWDHGLYSGLCYRPGGVRNSMENDCLTYSSIIQPIQQELNQFEKMYRECFHTETPVFRPLLSHLARARGKRLRPIFFFLCQGLFGKGGEKSVEVAVLLELLHAATLIHDDVVDESQFRRGLETPFSRWGSKISVLTGDYLLARVLSMGVKSPWPEVLRVISGTVRQMAHCELRQALGSYSLIPSRKEYYEIVRGKTAGFIAAAGRLGAITAGASPEDIERIRQVGMDFGMAFQMRDDILDLEGEQDQMGKPEFQDLENGMVTLPLILALESGEAGDRERIADLIGTDDSMSRPHLMAYIKNKNGLQRAQKRAARFVERAGKMLALYPSSPFRESLESLLDYHLERRK